MDDMEHTTRQNTFPPGTVVIAENGERLGTLRVVYPHYLLVSEDGSPQADLEVPHHAVARFEDGKLYLTVNREALSEVDDEESVVRRHPEQS